MVSNNLFDELLDAADRAGMRANSASSRSWFIANVKKIIPNISPTMVVKQSRGKLVENVKIGQMFLFFYDPKHKKTLPYYDRFPLVIPIEHYPDGFLGMNLHYLPPKLRAVLLGRLLETAGAKNLDERSRLRLSYQLLNSAAKYSYFKPTVKRYLHSHVIGKFVKVDGDEWESAIALPVESFVKSTKRKVWKDSISKI